MEDVQMEELEQEKNVLKSQEKIMEDVQMEELEQEINV